MVIGLGANAAKSLTNVGNASVTGLRGRLLQVPGLVLEAGVGVPAVYATYHPDAVLHGASHLAERIVEDLQRPLKPTLEHPAEEAPSGKILAFDTEYDKLGTVLTVALSDATKAIAFEPTVIEAFGTDGVPV